MFAAALLALSIAQGAPAQPGKLDQIAAQPEQKPANVAVVVLNCGVDAKALVDCKAVNDVDGRAAAEAMRMAAAVTLPESVADGAPARILIRMNVAP